MVSFAVFLTFLASLSLVIADISINPQESLESCLTLNTTTSVNISHVVSNLELQKCCPNGSHLNLTIVNEKIDWACFEGDYNVNINMVFVVNKEAKIYEPLKLTNYTFHVNTPSKRLRFQRCTNNLKLKLKFLMFLQPIRSISLY
jgi:hypothetical protein